MVSLQNLLKRPNFACKMPRPPLFGWVVLIGS
ncbi:hypothetical protein CFII64_14787 [Pseudomonas sp. CFII64]|nr:hypothetical protein CFII64_14787 [Pseudomonas sp. CFII64]